MAEEEKDRLAEQFGEFSFISRRPPDEREFTKDTIEKAKGVVGDGNVSLADASISIIKGGNQSSPCPVALVIDLKSHNEDPRVVVVPVDPYNLLNLAHKILKELDPSKA